MSKKRSPVKSDAQAITARCLLGVIALWVLFVLLLGTLLSGASCKHKSNTVWPADYYETMVDNPPGEGSYPILPSADTTWALPESGPLTLTWAVAEADGQTVSDSDRSLVAHAVQTWNAALPPAILQLAALDAKADPTTASITVLVRDDLNGAKGWTDTGTLTTTRQMAHVTIHLAASGMNADVATHEFGHALGIGGHSPDPADLMYPEPEVSVPTARDLATLAKIYQAAGELPAGASL